MRSTSVILLLGIVPWVLSTASESDGRPPNIVYIMADDLGFGGVSYNGQQVYSTPQMDRLSREGMILNQFYSGSPVCAPTRCTLMTGLHTGHAHIRGNSGKRPDGSSFRVSLRQADLTIAEVLQAAGYATACIGKWGIGEEGTEGVPWKQGFDRFVGLLNQDHASRHFPEFLYFNEEKRALVKNYEYNAKRFTQDIFLEESLAFIEANRDRPFFLYAGWTLPHQELKVPEADLAQVAINPEFEAGVFDDARTMIAMIQCFDRDVGRIVEKIDQLGLGRDTLIIATSDNGRNTRMAGRWIY
jgi:arylsulfatase A